LDGFSTLSKQLELTSENIVELEIVANGTHGMVLSPSYKIHLNQEVLENNTPNTHLINPQQVSLIFPDEYSTFSAGYRLVELYNNGELVDGNTLEFYADGDHLIKLTYDRVVKIIVNGDYWRHECIVCGNIWYSKNENPKVCSNVECTNRTNWKNGNKRK